ncbi:hypothetical protein [Cupriavidus necator]
MHQSKIVVVGAGLVGGSAALFAAVAIPSAEVVIIDVARIRAEGQALEAPPPRSQRPPQGISKISGDF